MKVKVYVGKTIEVEVDDKFIRLADDDTYTNNLAARLEAEIEKKTGIPCVCNVENYIDGMETFSAIYTEDDDPLVEY